MEGDGGVRDGVHRGSREGRQRDGVGRRQGDGRGERSGWMGEEKRMTGMREGEGAAREV